ncbi:hypothetical protein GGGNBK_07265 [Sporosarcina sp. ANT_H38]
MADAGHIQSRGEHNRAHAGHNCIHGEHNELHAGHNTIAGHIITAKNVLMQTSIT